MLAEKKLGALDYILRISSLYILIWAISPPLQHPMLFRIIVIGASLVWLMISLLSLADTDTNIHKTYLVVCVFCIMAIMIEWVCGNSLLDAIISQLQIIILLLFVLHYAYYSKYDVNFIKILTIIALICLSIWQVRTLIEYQANPGVSRLLVRSGEEAQFYASKGVGGYGLIYPSIFSNVCLMYLFRKVKGFNKILVLVPLVIGVLLVFSSGFLIAVIMTLVSLGCWFVRMFNNKNINSILISIFCLLIIVFVAMELLLQYSDSIIEALDGTFYKVKVKEIINALRTDQVTGKLEGRTSRYLESILGIFKYPIVGAKLLGYGTEIGGHSTLLDMVGLLGVFSFGFYFALYSVIRSIYKTSKYKGFIITIILLFVLNGVLNTLVGSHGIIFIVVPGAILLSKTEVENESTVDCSRSDERSC